MTRRRLSGALLAACAISLVTSCATLTDGKPVSVFADPLHVGGLAAVNGYSGLRVGAPPPVVSAEGSDDGPIDEIARQSITDIETYWDNAYNATFTGSFHQVNSLMSWDAQKPSDDEFCEIPAYRFVNTAFCPADYIIGWDRGVLMPAVRETYGDMAVTMLIAHEYGHAIQAMARLNQRRTPTLVSEQQADCLAGGYVRWVAEGNSPRFVLSTGEGLSHLLAVMIAIRDPLLNGGQQRRGDEHGSAFERISAFQVGFSEDAGSCAGINAKQVESQRAKLPIQLQRDQTGEWPVSEKSVRAITEEMNTLFKPATAPRLKFTTASAAPCRDAEPSPPASYCPDTNTITVDLPALQKMGTPPGQDDGYTHFKEGMSFKGFEEYVQSAPSLAGDNTAYSAFMSRYMLALQHQRGGLALDGTQAGLRTACLTGAATTIMATEYTTPEGDTIALSAGDLDEAVAGLLTNGLAASDVDGVSVPAGFSRIDAFRGGVVGTMDRCLARYP